MGVLIAGVGAEIPARRRSAEDVERRLGLPAGWIERRTGVRELPVVSEGAATSDLALAASDRALAASGIDRESVALLLLATSTPDYPLPPTAPSVAHRLGLSGAGAVDLAGACSGFLYALSLGAAHARVTGETVLVCGANVLTRRVDPADPMTAPLFADGAGAFVLVASEDSEREAVLSSYLSSDGSLARLIRVRAGGSRFPVDADACERGEQFMRIEGGPAVFRAACRGMARAGEAALSRAGLTTDDVDLWIPHQASRRIIREVGKRLGIPAERTVDVVARFGNSSAATIPAAFAEAVAEGRIRRGDTILMTAAGAGLVTAGMVVRF